jgi:hypothetical protein
VMASSTRATWPYMTRNGVWATSRMTVSQTFGSLQNGIFSEVK